MPKCHRKITICYLRGCVDSILKRCGFTGPLESHFIDWLKIKMCILLISFPSLSYLLVRLKMGSYFKGFIFLWCFLHICDADGKHFMTFPFVCSRTIFLSFSTGKDEGQFLIVGGKPSGRASEKFAFSQLKATKATKVFEEFKPNLTHAFGFHYQYNDEGEDFYVVTGGYDMVNHEPSQKAYLLDNTDGTVREANEFKLPVYQASAVSKY